MFGINKGIVTTQLLILLDELLNAQLCAYHCKFIYFSVQFWE